MRKIIHIDMDAFYASVEQHDHPELKGKPLAVGGSKERGVVAAASYEARKWGVRSAMPSVTAARLCPELIFVPPRFDRYKEISQHIRAIFLDYTDLVEPLSLDEAYLDVTENKKAMRSATLIAEEIRKRIFDDTGLTASAGISINKFLAKVASDVNKPNGQKLIAPEEVIEFLEQLDVQRFHGVGKVTAQKMMQLGIFTGADLKKKELPFLVEQFGKSGQHYYNIVRGIHNSEVKPDRIRKSLGAERTFDSDLRSDEEMEQALQKIAKTVAQRSQKSETKGKTITLKYKYSDFTQHTRARSLPYFVGDEQLLCETAIELLNESELNQPVRLLGITLSNLNTEEDRGPGYQLTLEF